MIRFFVRCSILSLFIGLLFLGVKKYTTSQALSTPLYLDALTFEEGMGLHSLGKHFILRHQADRLLFSRAKESVRAQRKEWKDGKRFDIPKKIHLLWLVKDPIPDYVLQNQACLKRLNPHCHCTIWHSSLIKKLLSEQETRFFDSLSPSLKRVWAAAFLLYHEGGVVIDSDLHCLASFEPLLSSAEWITSFEAPLKSKEEGRHLWISSSFFAAVPRHPLTKAWLDAMNSYFTSSCSRQNSIKKQYLTGMLLPLMKLLSSHNEVTKASLILPSTSFTPVAPQFIREYLKRLSGESSSGKEEKKWLVFRVSPTFSKIARESFALHLRGGTIEEFSSRDRKGKDPF